MNELPRPHRSRLAEARRRAGTSDLRRQLQGALGESELNALAADRRVDALGTFCPEPVIRTQKEAAKMSTGEVLLLLADDAGVEVDIPAWCLSTGNEFLGVLKETDVYRVFVRRAGSRGAGRQGAGRQGARGQGAGSQGAA